jgi:hypothetical protein
MVPPADSNRDLNVRGVRSSPLDEPGGRSGWPAKNRTSNLCVQSAALCQLSYRPVDGEGESNRLPKCSRRSRTIQLRRASPALPPLLHRIKADGLQTFDLRHIWCRRYDLNPGCWLFRPVPDHSARTANFAVADSQLERTFKGYEPSVAPVHSSATKLLAGC